MNALNYIFLGLLRATPLLCPALFAEGLVDVERATQRAQQLSIEKFSQFTQDKNVMGKPSSPSGQPLQPIRKQRMDKDGGGKLQFQGDLTYHDVPWLEDDKGTAPKDAQGNPMGPDRALPPFISDHGKVSSGGGSSKSERTVYGLHDKYAKMDEDKKKLGQQQNQKGIKESSIFREETREVFDTNNSTPTPNPNGQPNEKPTTARVTLRNNEIRKEIERLGTDSVDDTIERAAKDPENQNNSQVFPGLTLIYEAAKRATEALWARSVQKLGQRTAYVGAEGRDGMKLSEGTPDCESAAGRELQAFIENFTKNNNGTPPSAADIARTKRIIDRKRQQCQTLTAQNFRTVNPKFERPQVTPQNQNPEPQLKTGDAQKEDKFARDYRVQLEVWSKAGKSVTSVQSNWQYTKEDEQSERTQFNERGESTGIKKMSLGDQIDEWNSLLKESDEAYADVMKRMPNIPQVKASEFAIQKEQKSILELNRPSDVQMEYLGVQPPPAEKPPEDYQQLVGKQ